MNPIQIYYHWDLLLICSAFDRLKDHLPLRLGCEYVSLNRNECCIQLAFLGRHEPMRALEPNQLVMGLTTNPVGFNAQKHGDIIKDSLQQ